MISSYEIIEKYSVLVEKHSIKNQLEEYSDSLYTTVDNVYRTYDSTGFPALDPYLKKKDCPVGQLITIGARPSIGKTAFAVSLIRNMLVRGKEILFFSLEMSSKDIINRLVSCISKVSLYNIIKKKFCPDEFDRVITAIEYLWTKHLYIVDIPNISINALWDIAVADKTRNCVGSDCILIDHFGLIGDEVSSSDKYESFSRELQSIAQVMNKPVITMFQLPRVNNQREPSLIDMPCAMNSLVDDSDIVLFLHRNRSQIEAEQCPIVGEEDVKSLQVAKVIIAKNKNGDIGHTFLGFDDSTASFENIEHP